MRKIMTLLVVAFVCGAPAFAEDDPALKPAAIPDPVVMKKPGLLDRHPQVNRYVHNPFLIAYDCTYPVRHPLKTGRWCESSGFNGLLGAIGGLGSVATPFAVGAFK